MKVWWDRIGTCFSSSIQPTSASVSLCRVCSCKTVTSNPPTLFSVQQHLVWNDKMVPVQFALFLKQTRRSAAASGPFIAGSTHAICWPGRDHFLWIALSYNTRLFWGGCSDGGWSLWFVGQMMLLGPASAFTHYQNYIYHPNVMLPHHQTCPTHTVMHDWRPQICLSDWNHIRAKGKCA